MAGKVVKQLAGSGTGQSLSDMMAAVKHTLSGSVVAKEICKATTEEMIAPKKKHLTYLVQCTYEPRLSVPDFANFLVNRTQHNNLVVAFKALITIHHLMQCGSERFSQYIASNNCHFYLPTLHDRTSVQAPGINVFIKPYAKYLDEKAASYRECAFDFCRLKRGKDEGDMRNMPQDKLFKTLPVIEKQLDALLAFDATGQELVNSVLRVAHLFLYRDLIRLYAIYNEAMINLIGRYFTMSKRDCRIALELYRSFLKRMEIMNTFVKTAESSEHAGLHQNSDSENNTFQPVPPSVLEALEQHLAYLEAHKQSDRRMSDRTPPVSQPSPIPTSMSTTINTTARLESTNSSTTRSSSPSLQIKSEFVLTDVERRRIIEEERARLESFVTSARQHEAESDHRFNNDSSSLPNSQSSNAMDSLYKDLLMANEPFLVSTSSPWPQNDVVSSQMASSMSSVPPASSTTPATNQGSVKPVSAWPSVGLQPPSRPANAAAATGAGPRTGRDQNLLDLSEPISSQSAMVPVPPQPQIAMQPFAQQQQQQQYSLASSNQNPMLGGLYRPTNPFLSSSQAPQPALFSQVPANTMPMMSMTQPARLSSNNPWIAQPMAGSAQAFSSPASSIDVDFDRAFGLSRQMTSPAPQTPPNSTSLEAKLAQLAGNLSMYPQPTDSNTNPTPAYRAPDGSRTCVNWSGLPSQPMPPPPAASSVRPSASLNQISSGGVSGPAFRPSGVSTNPWSTIPKNPIQSATASTTNPLSDPFQTSNPPTIPNSMASAQLINQPVGSHPSASTNPFLF